MVCFHSRRWLELIWNHVGQRHYALKALSTQMPWSYRIDGERRLVVTMAWDTLTGAECLEQQRQLRSDTGFSPDFFQLLDFTRLTAVQIDLATIFELADVDVFSGKSRRAFLAPNPLAYGMSRMFIVSRRLTGEEQMRVFEDRSEALLWLGVAPFD